MGFEEEVPPDEPKLTRRNFVKGSMVAALGGVTGAAGVATQLSMIGEQPKTAGTVNPGFVYFISDEDILRGLWYKPLDGLAAFTRDFDFAAGQTGIGANVLWRQIKAEDEETGGERIVFPGMPAILIKLNPEFAPENLFETEGVVEFEGGVFVAFSGICVHLCCVPGWQKGEPWDLREKSPDGTIEKYPWIFCSCHGSRYDPFNIVEEESPDSGGKYMGAHLEVGPAPRSLPQIPLKLDGAGELIGIEDNLQWYDYC